MPDPPECNNVWEPCGDDEYHHEDDEYGASESDGEKVFWMDFCGLDIPLHKAGAVRDRVMEILYGDHSDA